MPLPLLHGMPSHAELKADNTRSISLRHHLDYLLNLGEVRATRVVATFVDGMNGHANWDDTIDMVYLSISMGYRSCYIRYMISLGFNTRCNPDGQILVDGVTSGKPCNHGYVSFLAYYNKWRKEYPQLKVSRPAEDICQYCFVFANKSFRSGIRQ